MTADYRLRVGIDSNLWQDNFAHSANNLSAYQMVTSTMNIGYSSNALTFNGGASFASGAVARVQTYRTFPTYATYPLYVEMWVRFGEPPVTNNVCEFGLGYATGTSTPTDGVYFKLSSSGALVGVANFGGIETTTSVLTAPVVNEFAHYLIVSTMNSVEFWINGVLEASIPRANTQPSPNLSLNLPLLLRCYNSASTSAAQIMGVGSFSISQGDLSNLKDWPTQRAGAQHGGLSAPSGSTSGQLQNYANSAAPASATLSNTTGGYTTLGGQFQFAAVAGAETDYALFAYTVPTGSSTNPGRSYFITDVIIETYNTGAAVATTATLLQWGLGLGGTAVTLATADSASAGTRAARRHLVGVQTFAVGAAIGAKADRITYSPTTPLMAEAGTVIHVLLKMPLGTATASQVIRGIVTLNGYFD
jgi:hypothetical protein